MNFSLRRMPRVDCPRCGQKTRQGYAGLFPVWFCNNKKCEWYDKMVRKDDPRNGGVTVYTREEKIL